MEKEKNFKPCLPCVTRQGKKLVTLFIAINIVVLLLFYYKNRYLSNINFELKSNKIRLVQAPIYNVPLFHIPTLTAKDTTPYFIEIKKEIWCFSQGTDVKKSFKQKKCICLSNYFGLDCGIPAAVWKSSYLLEGKNTGVKIKRREKPRRIITSIVLDDNIDMLSINIEHSFSVTDLYLTVEKNNFKPSVLTLFQSGYLQNYQSKIIPIKLNKTFTASNAADRSLDMLNELWKVGWNRVTDFRPDDLFLFLHVTSIISKDVLLFLKLYDGYPEPFLFILRSLIFKFSLLMQNNETNFMPFRPIACTFQFISYMCQFEIASLFSNNCFSNLDHKQNFEKTHWKLKQLLIGNDNIPSGWQCNICCQNDCIIQYFKDVKPPFLNESSLYPLLHKNLSTIIEKHFLQNENISVNIIPNSDSFFAPEVVKINKRYSYLTE